METNIFGFFIITSLFLYSFHVLCEIYPVFNTYIKHSRTNMLVTYTIFFFKTVLIDVTYEVFDKDDMKMFKAINFLNNFINMRIRIM